MPMNHDESSSEHVELPEPETRKAIASDEQLEIEE